MPGTRRIDRRAARVGVGDRAPDFALPDESGETVRLADFAGRDLVLFFYPKDATRGCTAQVCAFRDAHQAFVDAGAEVVGVSSDPVASHRAFAAAQALPYRLLSDSGGAVRRRFGVPRTLGLFAGRVTYLIDGGGIVRHVISSQAQIGRHVAEALAVLRALQDEGHSER